MSILLDHGAIVNIDDPKVFLPQILEPDIGWTALHVSVEGPGYDTVRMLLDNGATQNKKWDGRTPLHTALLVKREDLIPLLIQHGADLNATDVTHQTPVEYALSSGREYMAAIIRKCATADYAAANAAHGQFATTNATEDEQVEYYEDTGGKRKKKRPSNAITEDQVEDDKADTILQELRTGELITEISAAPEDDQAFMAQLEEMKNAQEGQATEVFQRDEPEDEKKKKKIEEDEDLAELQAQMGSDSGDEDVAALMADLEIQAAQNIDGDDDEDMDKLMADLAADVDDDDDEDLDKLMSQMVDDDDE